MHRIEVTLNKNHYHLHDRYIVVNYHIVHNVLMMLYGLANAQTLAQSIVNDNHYQVTTSNMRKSNVT